MQYGLPLRLVICERVRICHWVLAPFDASTRITEGSRPGSGDVRVRSSFTCRKRGRWFRRTVPSRDVILGLEVTNASCKGQSWRYISRYRIGPLPPPNMMSMEVTSTKSVCSFRRRGPRRRKKENCFPPQYGGHTFSEIGKDVRTSKRRRTNCWTSVWNGVSVGVSMFALCYDDMKNFLNDVHVCEHTI